MVGKWRRPADVPLPSVWRRYTGPKAMPDGRKPNFWIQDITPDWEDRVIDFMCDSFVKEETFCYNAGLSSDTLGMQEVRATWKDLLQQRASIVALTDWPDSPDHPRIAGCNMTYVTLPGEQLSEGRSPQLNILVRAMLHFEDKVNIFEKYGVDKYLNALGLSVSPDFRGQDLGRELLLARTNLGRALGLKLTVTVFSGAASHKQSARAGFELVALQRYDEYRNDDGKVIFPKTTCDSFQIQAKRLD